jgi:hypothetical protein
LAIACLLNRCGVQSTDAGQAIQPSSGNKESMMYYAPRGTSARVRSSFYVCVGAAILYVAPFAQAHAADTCESTFHASGSVFTGKNFDAHVVIPGLSAQSAVAQMKVLAAADGFEVESDTLAGSRATLQFAQKPEGNSRGFPIDFAADDEGQLTLKTALPAGISAGEKAMRTSMCGMLARVKPGGAPAGLSGPEMAAANPANPANPATTSGGALPVPYTPEDSTRLCEANFSDETDAVGGTRSVYGTWTLTSSGEDAHRAMARLKTFLPVIPGTRMVREEYHGAKGIMDLDLTGAMFVERSVMDVPDYRPLPVRVEFDGDMGAASLVIRTYSKQQGTRDILKYAACSMLAAASAGMMPPRPDQAEKTPMFRNPFKKEVNPAEAKRNDEHKRRDQGKDALFQRAEHAGKAFVAMPMLFMYKKYHGTDIDQVREEQLVNYWLDHTASVEWRRADDPAAMIRIGSTSTMFERGLDGFVYKYPGGGGKSDYAIFIVDPGTYELKGTSTEIRRAPMPDMSGKDWSSKPAFGTASFTATQDTEYYKTQEWQDAKYETKTYSETYCSLMNATTGGCVGYDVATRKYDQQVASAGYKDMHHDKQVGGLAMTTELSRPFATFRVGKGDVVYADGFVLDGASVVIDHDACKQTSEDVASCAMKSFNLIRVPAKAENIAEWQRSGMIAPSLATLLTRAKPAAMTLGAGTSALPEKPGTFDAGWGMRYSLKSK